MYPILLPTILSIGRNDCSSAVERDRYHESMETGIVESSFETAVALTDHTTNNADIESLDNQVKSMIIFSEGQGKVRICKVCGKESNKGPH